MPVRLNLHGTRVTTSSRYDRVRRGHMQDGVGIGGGKSEISVILLYVVFLEASSGFQDEPTLSYFVFAGGV